jgi:predicted ABC-type exoprotein transport system permease subunit
MWSNNKEFVCFISHLVLWATQTNDVIIILVMFCPIIILYTVTYQWQKVVECERNRKGRGIRENGLQVPCWDWVHYSLSTV